MAATKKLASVTFVYFILFTRSFVGFNTCNSNISPMQSSLASLGVARRIVILVLSRSLSRFIFLMTCQSSFRMQRPVTKWERHGYTLLAAREYSSWLDITVYMDVATNPGPATLERKQKCNS